MGEIAMQLKSDLTKQYCTPCQKGSPPLKGEALDNLYKQLKGWTLVDRHHLEKEYRFPDFQMALAFTNQVGQLAEQEGHHPDIYLGWGKVVIKLWTHKINGLSENDFILAAKCDALSAQC